MYRNKIGGQSEQCLVLKFIQALPWGTIRGHLPYTKMRQYIFVKNTNIHDNTKASIPV